MAEPALIRTCSIWRSLEILGDGPVLSILAASWQGIGKFHDLARETGLLQALLSDRLKRLVEARLLERQPYSSKPPRFAYVLSDKGRGTYWTWLMMLRWEAEWGDGAAGEPPPQPRGECCDRCTPEPVCDGCGGTIDPDAVEWRPGPGVGLMAPIYSRRRKRRDVAPRPAGPGCQAAQIVGDRWACLILRSIFTGHHRFDDIRQDLAIATNILTERLRWLEAVGFLRPEADRAYPQRHDYRPTDKGLAYYPVLLMLMRWGDLHYVAPEGPPVLLVHRTCGGPLDPRVVCGACRTPLLPPAAARDVATATLRSSSAAMPAPPPGFAPAIQGIARRRYQQDDQNVGDQMAKGHDTHPQLARTATRRPKARAVTDLHRSDSTAGTARR